ncbi:MAG: pitrilysin family protein [Acidobacteriota bacterium]
MKEDIRTSRLSNGLAILTDTMPDVRSVTLGFFYRIGSRHEPAELNGISHFIEHTVFKGTKRRTAFDIAKEQDRLGGGLDAFTTHEETGFVIKVIDDQIENAFDLLADMMTEPAFDELDLENERNVIIEEMKMVEDSPEDHLGEIFSEAFFPGHPLGMNIVGTSQSVAAFDHHGTADYHRQVFGPSNLVIAAAGNVDHGKIENLATRYFANGSLGSDSPALTSQTPDFGAPVLIRQNKNLEQAHLIIATPFVSATDEGRYAADMLANILGGGTSSRLWQKVREERGLAYSVGASTVMFRDCGYFSVYAGTSPEQTREVVDITMDELRDVVKNGVSEDELDLVKQQARASILLSLEDSASRAGSLANLEMTFGRQISVEETLERLDAVTLDEIQRLAQEHFQTEKIAFAAIGDLTGLNLERESFDLSY